MRRIELKINPGKKFEPKIKLGYHHTYPKKAKKLIVQIKPKVLRTYFDLEDIKLAKVVGAEPYVDIKPYNLLSGEAHKGYIGRKGDKTNPPRSWIAWKNYVKEKVEEFHKNNVFPKYYEIWNEPDRTRRPIFWKGTMEEYFKLYKYAFLGIREVDENALVGGPEICHFDKKWIEGLVKYCKKEKIELNFISFHNFRSPQKLLENVKVSRKIISRHQKVLKFTGEIHIGEWGFRVKNPNEALEHIHFAEKAGVDFYCKDFFYDKNWEGSLLTPDFKPKPLYWALLEYVNLDFPRIRVKENRDVIGFGSNKGEFKLLLAIRQKEEEIGNKEIILSLKLEKSMPKLEVKKLGKSGFKRISHQIEKEKVLVKVKENEVIFIEERIRNNP